MKIMHTSLLALSTAILLCSCKPSTTVVGDGSVINANDKGVTLRADGQPKAEITAAGDLKIDGKVVVVDAAQRALLQTYHHEMNAMAADGLAIGKQGAALAGKAVSEAIKGAISGNADDIESKVEAEAQKIEQHAMQLCKRLVTVMASQDALAASLPEFKPYATIDQSDVNDCGSDLNDSYAAGKDAGGSVARAVKGEKGESTDNMDAAARADAAATQAETAPDDEANKR